MWRRLLTYAIALLCIAIGLGVAAHKHVKLGFPLVPGSSINSWYVELHTTLQNTAHRRYRKPRESLVQIVVPKNTDEYAVVDAQTRAPGFGDQITTIDGQRYYHFTKRSQNVSEILYLQFMLYELDINDTEEPSKGRAKKDFPDNKYVKKNRLSRPEEQLKNLYDNIDLIVQEARSKSVSASSFIVELWKILDQDEGTTQFLLRQMDIDSLAALLVTLSQVSGYDASLANGLFLEEKTTRSQQIKQWVELHYKDQLVRFDPEQGNIISDDIRLYRWWSGEIPLISTENVDRSITTISTKPNIDSALTRALWQAREEQPIAYRFATQTLPLDQQLVLQVLLLMPLGGLIVAFLRQVIGVKTFGTFMPVLIALAFRETGAAFGIVFFVAITCIGLLLRSYLNRLRLLFVPRLSAVLCVVVALITLAMFSFKDTSIPMGVSIALFPVVIMTMFIERMSTVWDESGPKPALIACIGSLMVAWLVYVVTIIPEVKHAMVTFPELLFVIFGLCLILGRYNGYRVSEYIRFRQLQRTLKEIDKQGAV